MLDTLFDQSARQRDPTGTERLQRRFEFEGKRRLNALKLAVQKAVVDGDVLGLKLASRTLGGAGLVMTLLAKQEGGSRVSFFSDWLHATQLNLILEQGGEWMRPFVQASYQQGVDDASGLLGGLPVGFHGRSDFYYELATIELHGIVDEIDKQGAREAGRAITEGWSPRQAYRAIADRIDKIGSVRFSSLVSHIAVQAHAEASLDVYEAAGHTSVTLVPEFVHRVGDSMFHDAPRLKRRPGETQEDYEERRDRTQARRAIQRAKREGGALGRALKRKPKRTAELEVLTAGDADVCPICERLARTTYTIREARGVLPAHNNCRCVWVTVGFGEDDE